MNHMLGNYQQYDVELELLEQITVIQLEAVDPGCGLEMGT